MDSSDASKSSDQPALQIRLFGDCDIRIDGERLPAPELKRAQTLLAYLVLNKARPSPFQEIARELWPLSESTESGLESVRAHLSCLRQWLDSESMRILKPSKSAVQVDLSGAWVDVVEFQQACKCSDSGALLDAVDLYRGGFLIGMNGPWVENQRQDFEAAYRQVLERLVQAKSAEELSIETSATVERPLLNGTDSAEPTPPRQRGVHKSRVKIQFGLSPVLGLMALSAIIGAATFGFTTSALKASSNVGLPKRSPVEIVVDDAHRADQQDDFGFWLWGKRRWIPVNGSGINGQYLKILNNRRGKLDNVGEWRPELPKRANYEISAYIPKAENRANNVVYEIWIAGALYSRKEINQASYGDEWVSLGTYPCYDDGHDFVRLLDTSREQPKYIVFDAIKFTLRE